MYLFGRRGGPSRRETPVPEEVHPPLTLRAENEFEATRERL